MASYELDRRGSHYDDLRAGTIASTIANANRNSKVRKEPYGPLDFMTWNELGHPETERSEPILLADPVAQSNLLRSMVFPKRNG